MSNKKLASLSIAATLMSTTAIADVPSVVADIAPVHSLVARVMEGVGAPDLLMPPGASPHEYSLRPSEAEALQDAQIVFWIGPDLEPWLDKAIANLTTDADTNALMEAEGTTLLEKRESALFERHSHGDEEHEDDEEHEGDEDHKDDDSHEDDKHVGDEAHEDDEHAHASHDSHVWLSPANAAVWLNRIAATLSSADPDNAGAYFANAAAARAEMDALVADVDASLAPKRNGRFIVFHDAYQYFETDFDFPASGAISLSDATEPSPARIAEIQSRVRDEGIDCVLAEPQYNPGIVTTVLDGTEAKTGVIDPLGVDLVPGPALYPALIRNLANTLVECL